MDFNRELLLIDKPSGITSFDVIRRLRRIYTQQNGGKAPKMGHAGTLDPLATGLMIIGVGPGTKRLEGLTRLGKEYLAEVRIGESRTTGDIDGEVMASQEVRASSETLSRAISETLDGMIGETELPVSAYSAIKVDGVPMYKRARKAEAKGETVEVVPVRTMRVYEAELFNVHQHEGHAVATIRFQVGSGTYIRSLAEELGKRIGYPATIQALRRTKVGDFHIDMAESLPETK